MLHRRAKTGVTVTRVSRNTLRSNDRKKINRTFVRVNKVSRSSLSRNEILFPSKPNNANDNYELENISDRFDLKKSSLMPIALNQSKSEIHSVTFDIKEISSGHRVPTKFPRIFTLKSNKSDQRLKFTTLWDKSFLSNKSKVEPKENFEEKTHQHDKTNSYEMHREKRRRYIRRICPFCSNCCCFVSTLALLLFLIGLAGLLFYIFTRQHPTTTTTSTTTTSTTTSTTSATTTTSTSTSSTSTSSTSITSITTTTATTTPTPPCLPTSIGSNSTLNLTTANIPTLYQCFAYAWTSPTTGLVTLAFQLRNDQSNWYLDDVSVYGGATQMISNGGFETGSLSPWVIQTPFGHCMSGSSQVNGSSPRTGSYSFEDGCYGRADQISQQFNATAGQIYVVSFWLKSGSIGSGISASVTLS